MYSVVETPIFTRRADALLSAEDRAALIAVLAADPRAGTLIPGLGGIRKMCFAPAGQGKSGALPVTYFVLDEHTPVLALLLYGKNEQVNPTPDQRKVMLRLVGQLKAATRAACTAREAEMAKRRAEVVNMADDLVASLEQALAISRGERAPGRVHQAAPPAEVDVQAARQRLGMSQPAFAAAFGVALPTLRKWEQRVRRPEGPARVLLRVIEREPEAVRRALAEDAT